MKKTKAEKLIERDKLESFAKRYQLGCKNATIALKGNLEGMRNEIDKLTSFLDSLKFKWDDEKTDD